MSSPFFCFLLVRSDVLEMRSVLVTGVFEGAIEEMKKARTASLSFFSPLLPLPLFLLWQLHDHGGDLGGGRRPSSTPDARVRFFVYQMSSTLNPVPYKYWSEHNFVQEKRVPRSLKQVCVCVCVLKTLKEYVVDH